MPDAFVTGATEVISELDPEDCESETALPANGCGLGPWSRRVTVTVEEVEPSAGTSVGLALTTEFTGDTN
jgi:hypothetical protein